MAKIRVKLRSSSIEGKAGTIYYYVSHKRVVRHITTNIHLLPEEWDEEQQHIISGRTDSDCLQNRIDSDMAALQKIVGALEAGGKEFSANDIVSRFCAPERHVSVLSFF